MHCRLRRGGRNGLNLEDGGQEVLDDGVLVLLARSIDLLDLLLGILARLVLGGLVSLAVLVAVSR